MNKLNHKLIRGNLLREIKTTINYEAQAEEEKDVTEKRGEKKTKQTGTKTSTLQIKYNSILSRGAVCACTAVIILSNPLVHYFIRFLVFVRGGGNKQNETQKKRSKSNCFLVVLFSSRWTVVMLCIQAPPRHMHLSFRWRRWAKQVENDEI